MVAWENAAFLWHRGRAVIGRCWSYSLSYVTAKSLQEHMVVYLCSEHPIRQNHCAVWTQHFFFQWSHFTSRFLAFVKVALTCSNLRVFAHTVVMYDSYYRLLLPCLFYYWTRHLLQHQGGRRSCLTRTTPSALHQHTNTNTEADAVSFLSRSGPCQALSGRIAGMSILAGYKHDAVAAVWVICSNKVMSVRVCGLHTAADGSPVWFLRRNAFWSQRGVSWLSHCELQSDCGLTPRCRTVSTHALFLPQGNTWNVVYPVETHHM